MYLGRYSAGDYISFTLPSRTPDGEEATLAYVPEAKIYKQGVFVTSSALHVNSVDRKSLTSNYIIPASLAKTTITKYEILYSWIIGTDNYYATDNFDIVPTSTSYGAVIGLFGVTRAGGQWVITQIDERGLSLGYNPSGN